MRKFSLIYFIIATFLCVLGAILALCGVIDWSLYRDAAAIVGTIASIIGILGLTINPLKNADINQLRSDGLKKLAKTAEEIEKSQEKMKETSEQINQLTIKKNDLEILVEQASLSIYYKKELERFYEKLKKQIEINDEIHDLIEEIELLEKESGDLNCKIEKNKEIKEIIEIIHKAQKWSPYRINKYGIEFSFLGGTILFRP